MEPTQYSDYGKLLAVLNAFDIRQVDATPSVEDEPRLQFGWRVCFCFLLEGKLTSYLTLKGEAPLDIGASASAPSPEAATEGYTRGDSDYDTFSAALAGFNWDDVTMTSASGERRIILSDRITFCFSPDGKLTRFLASAQPGNKYVRARPAAAPAPAAAPPVAKPAPSQAAAKVQFRATYPERAREQTRAESPNAPDRLRKEQ